MKTVPCLLLIFLAQLAIGQSGDANYYPLKVGYEWTYKMNEDNEQTVRVTEYSDEYKAFLVTTIFRIGAAFPVTSDDLIEPRKNKILRLGSRGGLGNSDWHIASNLLMQYPPEGKVKLEAGR
jgi:hypothetical protein